MLQDVKEKVIRFGVSIPTLQGVIGNLKRRGHFQPPPPTPHRVNPDSVLNRSKIACACLLHPNLILAKG